LQQRRQGVRSAARQGFSLCGAMVAWRDDFGARPGLPPLSSKLIVRQQSIQASLASPVLNDRWRAACSDHLRARF
jgi:hypothetical protein